MTTLIELANAGEFHLDVEYGNASDFYSGVKCADVKHLGAGFESAVNKTWVGKLINTDVLLDDGLNVKDNTLERKLSFTVQNDSKIFDFVSRFVIYSQNARSGFINSKTFEHVSKNIYRQFSVVDGVSVPVGNSGYLNFSSLGTKLPEGFDEVFYIRDEAKNSSGYRWIVHHRLIVDPKKVQLVLRSCNPRFEGPLPLEQYLPNFIKRPLFRIREAFFPNFPIMAVGEAQLKKGDLASIVTRVEYLSE